MSPIVPIAYLEAEIDGEKRRFAVPADSAVSIGRSVTASVVLNDDSVSRRHALLQRAEDNRYYISDLGSSNGTYVNQRRISSPSVLRTGDTISIGTHTLTFCHAADEQAAMPTAQTRTTSFNFAPKLVTVMVADIRDFTALSRRVKPNVLSLLTATLFRQAGKALQERGAWEQKYIGDAVMAIWLHGSLDPTPAEFLAIFQGLLQVVSIAGDLQSSLGLDAPIRLGVGINTGWASVGNVGSVASSDHTALGEMVNKAFRLEAATKELACDLALGQSTYDFLLNSTDAGRIFKASSVVLKGYEEPVTAYTAQQSLLPALLNSFCL